MLTPFRPVRRIDTEASMVRCRGVQQAVNGQTISWQKPNVVVYLSGRQDERREGLGWRLGKSVRLGDISGEK
jgi:hypothetical protein